MMAKQNDSKAGRKRKRGSSTDACQLYGRYDLRLVTQKLTSVMGEARLEQKSGSGCYAIHMEKINTVIQVDQNSGQTHVVVDESEAGGKGHDGIRAKIRDVLVSCSEKY